MSRGKFFVLEGLDGCGKSTQLQNIKAELENQGNEVVVIRDPGGTRVSEKIREVLLDPECTDISSMTELMLYSASRAQLVNEIIKPALDSGKIVLADRFGWSTMAYQGYGRGLNIEQIGDLLRITCGEYWPDHSFIMDIPVEVFRERSEADDRTPDRIENEDYSFFQRVREGYQNIAQKNSKNVTLIDGTLEISVIKEKIVTIIQNSI